MKTQRWHVRTDGEYRCRVCVEFSDIDTDADIRQPVEGDLTIIISEDVPHPVELGIEDIDEKGDAPYVQFENRMRSVDIQHGYPVDFHFTTGASRERGGKWYFYRTADWNPDSSYDEKDNPEFVKHHTPGIPSAQRIRLIHRILEGNAGEGTIHSLLNLYDGNPQDAASKFSDDIKNYVGFEARAKIQDFLMERTQFRRSESAAVNKVAKQLLKDKYQHRVDSLEDVEEMVSVINELRNFPDITTEEVFKRVIDRSEKEELEEIADQIHIHNRSTVFSDSN